MSRTHKNVTETLDHDGPKLKSDGEAETLDHGGPKLKVKEAGMGNQEKLFSKEIEDRSTDKEQLPETGGCIFLMKRGKE